MMILGIPFLGARTAGSRCYRAAHVLGTRAGIEGEQGKILPRTFLHRINSLHDVRLIITFWGGETPRKIFIRHSPCAHVYRAKTLRHVWKCPRELEPLSSLIILLVIIIIIGMEQCPKIKHLQKCQNALL